MGIEFVVKWIWNIYTYIMERTASNITNGKKYLDKQTIPWSRVSLENRLENGEKGIDFPFISL